MIGRTYMLALALGAATLAQPLAAASHQCNFTTECFEDEACSDTAFSVTIQQTDGKTTLVSDAETIAVSIGGSDSVKVYVGVTDSAFHLLTRTSEGASRYSTHLFEGPLMINYLGTCEGVN